MLGQTLGHYRIVAEIGRGGMGVVYRAHDEVLHRDVALKVLAEQIIAGKPAREFLLHEARAASALNHPNICTVHDVGDDGQQLYVVMEMVEGRNLKEIITGTGPSGSSPRVDTGIPVESVMRYGVQVAGALMHAHGRGVVHRDLKSHNISVTGEGLVKVLDFGLARRLPSEAHEGATQTVSPLEGSSTAVGTLAYMAPEILRGSEGDARSDIWALGVVLYEGCTGQLPFRGKTTFEISSAIMNDMPAAGPSWIPPGLWAIVQRCLVKDPAQRYQRASEVQAALEAVQSFSIAAPAPPVEQGTRFLFLRGMKHLTVKAGDLLLMIGTTKGAFLMRSDKRRARWDTAGPYFHGQAMHTMAYDNRAGRRRLWAATNSPFWGAFLRCSDDFGRSWTNPQEAQIRFPAESGASLNKVWQIHLGRPDEPDTMYCGVDPAALFESRDAGDTWSLVRGLFHHPHRPRWTPANSGLCLHTIVPDPLNRQRMFVAVSSGGVYRTDDGGATWQARNQGVRVTFGPERYPEFGQCVHRIAMHPQRPERLFLQNHWGLYRSDDAGDSWQDIANGVPSDFGFALIVHPRKPDWVYVVPVESDEFRCAPEGRLRVYRTRNAGESWEPLMRGLPQKGAYDTVLRDGFCADLLDPVGIYFGTRRGNVYFSADDGKNWKQIAEGLPPVVCVKAEIVGGRK
jgi:serine/threonine protein kinase/photosystem II stability/assembly factor-like uncharacterized protein